MRPIRPSLDLLRRLLAGVLALSVLYTTLGWAHAPCDTPPARQAVDSHDAAIHVAAHDEMAGMDGQGLPVAATAHGTTAEHSPVHGSGHDQHDASSADLCALVAHCTAAAVVGATVPATADVEVAERPLALSDTRPLEPAFQPDSPPPKG